MKTGDIIGMGLMLFAFFLGAGNLIFPPWAGSLSGENLWWSLSGYLLTDVGLSLVAIVAIALAGTPQSLTRDLPAGLGTLFWILVYLIIGPIFALPRTAQVAFAVGISPWMEGHSASHMVMFSTGFFLLAGVLCLYPGKLVTVVGKILLPMLAVVLAVIYVALFTHIDFATLHFPAQGAWAKAPMFQGAVQGYLTMDTLGALGFGLVIVTAFATYGITDRRLLVRYTLLAAVIAGVGLSLVYLGLFFLGAASKSLMSDATNGAQILTFMVQHLLGGYGQFALSVVIVLACLTTAVGISTAIGEYFHLRWPVVPYRFWIVSMCALSALIANIGLDTLINISRPVVVALYPLAILLLLVEIIRLVCPIRTISLRIALLVTLLISGANAWQTAHLPGDLAMTHYIPLYEDGLGWLLPSVAILFLDALVSKLSARPISKA